MLKSLMLLANITSNNAVDIDSTPSRILQLCWQWRQVTLKMNVDECTFIFKKRSAQRLSRNISDPYMNSDPEGGSVCYGVHVFSYKDLDEATNNFDSKKELGDGGFGTVYHGKLKDGRDIAVKRLYEHNYKRVEQFKNEVEILTRLRHKNLVSLYGCTSRRCRELLLVYEYIPNGTVADHLHGDRAQTSPLTWPVRISIAIETATALAYLHASEIVHRDVKTNNILLDDNFCVKVADFGLSRLFPNDVTHVSTAPQGTPGYVDPEYHQCYQLTSKSDVYSFGVVLVELISSMPAVDITRHRLEINLSNLAISKIQKGAYNELVDLRLGFDSNNEVKRMTIAVAELAFQCLQQDKEMRPSMDEVLDELKRIENGNNESENHEKGFDGVTTSEQPPPSPECHEVGLLKRMNEQPPSPNTVIENWPTFLFIIIGVYPVAELSSASCPGTVYFFCCVFSQQSLYIGPSQQPVKLFCGKSGHNDVFRAAGDKPGTHSSTNNNHGLISSISAEEQIHHPACPPFRCGKFGDILPPFRNNSNSKCGLYTVDCSEPVPKIQLKEGGYWYELDDISRHGHHMAIKSGAPPAPFADISCESKDSFALPSPSMISNLSTTYLLTVFNCSQNSGIHVPAGFDHTPCRDYDIYYTLSNISFSAFTPHCSMIQLPGYFQTPKHDPKHGISNSPLIILEVHVNDFCRRCYSMQGLCKPMDKDKFICLNAEKKKGIYLYQSA
ncbi:putative serine/threonine-protein kinase [Morus notabilis]|uniref:non-specific serine/threonine protein kinase n=1 Tax=Morus notabilis TaxID=981085 RepID=W9R9G8_9ROSA|nr:putative serine/threonine-protein kinase [Morus notabilis]